MPRGLATWAQQPGQEDGPGAWSRYGNRGVQPGLAVCSWEVPAVGQGQARLHPQLCGEAMRVEAGACGRRCSINVRGFLSTPPSPPLQWRVPGLFGVVSWTRVPDPFNPTLPGTVMGRRCSWCPRELTVHSAPGLSQPLTHLGPRARLSRTDWGQGLASAYAAAWS